VSVREVRILEVDDAVERLLFASDLHAFIEPLEAFDEVRAPFPGPTQVVVGGDLFLGGNTPVETLEWVRAQAGQFAVLGNHDEVVLKGSEGNHPPYTEEGAYDGLDTCQIDYLRNLAEALEIRWKGKQIRVLHRHRTLVGEAVSWLAKPRQLMER